MTRILLVDDDANLRDALKAVLEASGHEVVVAKNGREALRLTRDSEPHVIVSDVTMPLMDGIEMTRQISAMPVFEQLPVVLMSARAAVPAVPVAAMLRKPFAPSELLAVLDGLATRSVANEEWALDSPLAGTANAEDQLGGLAFAVPGDKEGAWAASARERRIRRGIELVRAQEERLRRLHHGSVNWALAEELYDCLRVSVATLVELKRASHSGMSPPIWRTRREAGSQAAFSIR
ncbi:response regulator [Paraburkholderia diazotrophica]|uniref:Response regulator receiver domain-containing protein n=1 Tax=Paraburkholderia diazotrophica TaxID=667676 RepID=A0A1H6SIX5_9BURK|nr:response regulator [Paraburkholderia diazotrophica]SEI63725.1 Response regulator receiver domain-containing protein [Paraburkholderia diazotrophica]